MGGTAEAEVVECGNAVGFSPYAHPTRAGNWGGLGAALSASPARRGLPLPVAPHCQPAGTVPGWSLSKVSVWANATLAPKTLNAAISDRPLDSMCVPPLDHPCTRRK